MGAIATGISAAFRDFDTDGVPSSGAYRPAKSPIRALGAVIEDSANHVFLQAGSGAVSRTAQAKLRDTAHVNDFDGTLATALTSTARGKFIATASGGAYAPGSVVIDPDKIFTTAMLPASGRRGALFILSNPTGASLDAGQASGAQIWVGDNPVGTPGTGDSVALSVVNNNGNGRAAGSWGMDVVVGIYDLGAGYLDQQGRCVEFEIANGFSFTEADPFGPGNRKNGVELFGTSGSVGKLTAALTTWANDTTGAKWWDQGAVFSRVASKGIRFIKNPGGATDTGIAFSVAAIFDESDSLAVLAASGSHGSIIDLAYNPTYNEFIRGRTNDQTTINVKNSADYPVILALDSGASAAQISGIDLSDRNSPAWRIQKAAGGSQSLFITSDPLGSPINAVVISRGSTGALGVGGAPTITGLDVVLGGFRVGAGLTNAANDAAAAAAGVGVNSFYRNGSVAMIRVV